MIQTLEERFEELWQAYRKKRSKGQARRTYMKLAKKGALPPQEVLLAAIRQQQGWPDWKKNGGQYQPYLSSWLNDDGWLDEPGAGTVWNGSGKAPTTKPDDDTQERVRERARRAREEAGIAE